MSRFIDETDRSQGTLLPETIDEYVAEENPLRVIDAFVEALDLAGLGFAGVEPKATGRPAYHPATMLKIYLYGYLNRVQPTRRLEQMQARLEHDPTLMTVRRRTVEHPFGTIKAWMGATHCLCRRLPRVSAEMSLNVLAYNLKRVMKIMGTGPMIKALRA